MAGAGLLRSAIVADVAMQTVSSALFPQKLRKRRRRHVHGLGSSSQPRMCWAWVSANAGKSSRALPARHLDILLACEEQFELLDVGQQNSWRPCPRAFISSARRATPLGGWTAPGCPCARSSATFAA